MIDLNGFRKFVEEFFSVIFSYSKRERRGIIVISVILLVILAFMEFQRTRSVNVSRPYIELLNAVLLSYEIHRDSLFYFDPNTISIDDLKRLGFTEKQANAIDNYRKSGAIFRKPEDFGRSFIVTEEMLEKLMPYMVIEYTVIGKIADETIEENTFLPVDINTADETELQRIKGIGNVFSRRIISYREKLGGYAYKEQLLEVKGINEDNFSTISEQFFIDLDKIKKIDINFASSNMLRSHPYFTKSMTDRIIYSRNIKGGWSTLKELIDNDILLPDEAEKIYPYIIFGEIGAYGSGMEFDTQINF